MNFLKGHRVQCMYPLWMAWIPFRTPRINWTLSDGVVVNWKLSRDGGEGVVVLEGVMMLEVDGRLIRI